MPKEGLYFTVYCALELICSDNRATEPVLVTTGYILMIFLTCCVPADVKDMEKCKNSVWKNTDYELVVLLESYLDKVGPVPAH